MASWMIHLRIADRLLDQVPGLDETAFVMGNIAPDSGVPNADWSAYFPPKNVSHYKVKRGNESFFDLDLFIREHFSPELIRSYSLRAFSFFLGYYAHLLTDVEWITEVLRPSFEAHPEKAEKDRTAFIWELKRDWYDLDFRYLKEHPDFRAFRIYEQSGGFRNDLMDIFSEDAFSSRREYICGYYRGEHGDLYREYPYMKPEQADKFVSDAARRVLSALQASLAVRNETARQDQQRQSRGRKMEEYIRFLEKIAGNGHVALNTTEYDGWLLRFSGGYTCRANSVSVLRPSRKGIEEKVAYCEARYAEQGLPAIFKVTEPDAELAGYLLKRGYSVVTPTDVMVLDLEKAELSADMNDCVFDAEPWEWLPAYYEFENRKDPAVQAIYNGMLSRVTVDTCYCTVMKDGKPAACASTAAEQGYALLQNVVVDPAMRGQGIGEKLCRAILAKEKERGTRYAYLQVVQANTAAVKLYEKLGFSRVYTYRYMKQAK